MDNEIVYIYGMADPATMEIRYVGQTNDLRATLARHISDTSDCRKAVWIRTLHSIKLTPIMVVLEETDRANADHKESEWIERGAGFGWSLTNTMKASHLAIVEDRKNIKRNSKSSLPPSPWDYDLSYLFQRLKDNHYRPIVMHGSIVQLIRTSCGTKATMCVVSIRDDGVNYHDMEFHFKVSLSELPAYAIKSLDICRFGTGESDSVWRHVLTIKGDYGPDIIECSRKQVEPTETCRTFFAMF